MKTTIMEIINTLGEINSTLDTAKEKFTDLAIETLQNKIQTGKE